MPLRTTLVIFALISLLTVAGGGLFITSQLSHNTWKVAQNHTNRTTQLIQEKISFYLTHYNMTSNTLARIPQIRKFFGSAERSSPQEVNNILGDICITQMASLCYLMDSNGLTVASSDFDDENSILGNNYGFRPYFKAAIKGQPTVYLALGVTTKKRGFYFSFPVISGLGNIKGVAVIKYPVEQLEAEYSGIAGIFTLTNPNGMIFATNQKDWLFRTQLISHDNDNADTEKMHPKEGVQTVDLMENSEGILTASDGTSYLYGSQDLPRLKGWRIHYYFDTTNISSLEDESLGSISLSIVLALFSAIGLIIIFLYHHATREIKERQCVELNLRESEEKYRLLFEMSEDPMWVIYDNVFMMANHAAAIALGYASSEELRNIHPSDLSPTDQNNGETSFEKANRMISIAYDKGYHRFEWIHMRKNGEEFPVEVSLTRIPFQQKDALFCVWRDITENKQAQIALEFAKEEAENATRTKSLFLSSMSHEIRTPMTGIIGFSDMLLDDDLPAQSRDKVLRIKGATHSLLRLINDILDMSKMEAGKMSIEHIDFHLHDLIQDVMALVENTRRSDGHISLKLSFSETFPQTIKSDPTRIRQILVNLVGNAIKFTHEGEIVVSGEQVNFPDGQQKLRITVKDSGIGMSAETVDNLFSEFTQADASISRKYEGTGLGLAISKKLVELLDGDISVESKEGVGSDFIVTLPYIAATSEITSERRLSVNTSFKALQPLNVLVAEDNRVNQLIIKKFMEGLGHQVDIVENGKDAISSHKRTCYDLILMDVRMPEMDGLEATQAIRQMEDDKAKIPIIAVTADAMKEHIESYHAAGMNHFVSKPYDRTELALAINQTMGADIHIAAK